jgi:hypothetical protein
MELISFLLNWSRWGRDSPVSEQIQFESLVESAADVLLYSVDIAHYSAVITMPYVVKSFISQRIKDSNEELHKYL